MWAFGLDFDARAVREFALPDPAPPGPGEVLLAIEECGVCGTDRELAAFRLGRPPEGETKLAIGHEAVARVIAVGPGVSGLLAGSWAVPAVRRACQPACRSCAGGRRDLCLTGGYRERGIFGLHGYCAEFAIEQASDLTPVPDRLREVAVLVEPMSVVEKAVETALRIHPGRPETALVIGAGPVGVLAALVLELRGLRAVIHSLEPAQHPRARAVEAAGIEYRPLAPEPADIVIEAAGSSAAGLLAIRSLRPLGVCGILGAPDSSGPIPFMEMIVGNQSVFGSVNAGPEHFRRAVEDLARLSGRALRSWIRPTERNALSYTLLGGSDGSLKVVHRIATQ